MPRMIPVSHSTDNSFPPQATCETSDQKHCEISEQTRSKTTPAHIAKPKIYITRKPPTLDKEAWEKYDKEFSDINKVSWECLRKGKMTPEQFVSDLNGSLASFLESKTEFQKESKQFFEHKPRSRETVETMRKLKIELNKKSKRPGATEEDKIKAKESIRTYSHLLKINKEKEKFSLEKKEEKMYRTNFWKTAKDVTNGIFGELESAPTFDKATAEKYYKDKYESPVKVDLKT